MCGDCVVGMSQAAPGMRLNRSLQAIEAKRRTGPEAPGSKGSPDKKGKND